MIILFVIILSQAGTFTAESGQYKTLTQCQEERTRVIQEFGPKSWALLVSDCGTKDDVVNYKDFGSLVRFDKKEGT